MNKFLKYIIYILIGILIYILANKKDFFRVSSDIKISSNLDLTDCKKLNKVNCISYCGGGNRAMFSYFAIYNTLKKNKNRNVNNDLFKNIDYISGNSGGTWFIGHLAYEKTKKDNAEIKKDYFETDVYKEYFKNLWKLYDPSAPETTQFWSDNNIPNLKENFDITMDYITKIGKDIFDLDVFKNEQDVIANYIMYIKNVVISKIQNDYPTEYELMLTTLSVFDLSEWLTDIIQKLFEPGEPGNSDHLLFTRTVFKLTNFLKTVLISEIKTHLQHLCVYLYGFIGINWHDMVGKFIFKDFNIENLNMDDLKTKFKNKNITFITGIHRNTTINENITGQILSPEYYLDENEKLNNEKLRYNMYPKLSQNGYENNNLHSVSKYYGDSIPIFLGNNITKIYPGDNSYYKDRINNNINVNTNNLREYSNIDGFTVGGGGTWCKSCYVMGDYPHGPTLTCERNQKCLQVKGYKKELTGVFKDCKDDICVEMPCVCYNGTSHARCVGNYAQNCNICNENYELVDVKVDNKIISRRCVKKPEASENVNICNSKSDCENIKLSIIYKDNRNNTSITKNINLLEIDNKINLLNAMTSSSSAISFSSNFIYNIFNNITNNYIYNMHTDALTYHIRESTTLTDIASKKTIMDVLLNQNGLLDHISQQLIDKVSDTDIFQDIQLALFSKLGNTIKGSSLNSKKLEFNNVGIRDYINTNKDPSLDEEYKKKVENDIPLLSCDGGYMDNTGILANVKKIQDNNEKNCKLLSINSDPPNINFYKKGSPLNSGATMINDEELTESAYITRILAECNEKVYGTSHTFAELFGLQSWDHIDFNESKGNIVERSKYIAEYDLIRKVNIEPNKYNIDTDTSSMDTWMFNNFMIEPFKSIILFTKLITHEFNETTMFSTGDKIYANKDVKNRELFRGTSIYTSNTKIFNSDDFFKCVIIDDNDTTGNKYINNINKIKDSYITTIQPYYSIQNFKDYYDKINSYKYNNFNRYYTLNKIDDIEYNYDNHIVSYYDSGKQIINSKLNYIINKKTTNETEYRQKGFNYTYDINYSRMVYVQNLKTIENKNFGIKEGTNIDMYFLINYINLSLLGPTPEINTEELLNDLYLDGYANTGAFLFCHILNKLPYNFDVCKTIRDTDTAAFMNSNLEILEDFIKKVIDQNEKHGAELFNFKSINDQKITELLRLENLENLIADKTNGYINILDSIH